MRRRSATDGRGRWIAAAFAAAAAGPCLAMPTLDFDRTFVARYDRQQVHYEAAYRIDGREHRIAVWRDGEVRVKRLTDDAIATFVSRPAGTNEWSMTVLDLHRKIRTDVDRTNLLRIGHFTDWFAQGHSLSRPRGSYRLAVLSGGVAGIHPVASCRWYELAQAERTTRLCWNSARGVPIVIVAADGEVVWQVTRLTAGPFPDRTFQVDDRGYVRNDANQDIQAD